MRPALLLALLALVALAGAASGPPARGACAAAVSWRGADYAGWAVRAPLPVGPDLGAGTAPACRDTIVVGRAPRPVTAPRPVALRAIAGVAPSLAVAVDGDRRTAYLASGTLPQLPSHPLHRAIYGRDDRPLETRGRDCAPAPAARGRVRGGGPIGEIALAPGAGPPVRALVDARTRVDPELLDGGAAGLVPGRRVAVGLLRCDGLLVARRVVPAG